MGHLLRVAHLRTRPILFLCIGLSCCGPSEPASSAPHGCDTEAGRLGLEGWSSTIPASLQATPPAADGVVRVEGRIVELDLRNSAAYDAPEEVSSPVGVILDGETLEQRTVDALNAKRVPLGVRIMHADRESVALVSQLDRLVTLWIYGSELTGEDVGVLARVPGLRALSIGSGLATDEWGAALGQLRQLEVLSLSGSPRFSDAGLSGLTRLTSLRALSVSQTGVGNEGVRALAGMSLRCIHAEQSAVLADEPALESILRWR